jgi:hypothetical protein
MRDALETELAFIMPIPLKEVRGPLAAPRLVTESFRATVVVCSHSRGTTSYNSIRRVRLVLHAGMLVEQAAGGLEASP